VIAVDDQRGGRQAPEFWQEIVAVQGPGVGHQPVFNVSGLENGLARSEARPHARHQSFVILRSSQRRLEVDAIVRGHRVGIAGLVAVAGGDGS